jgi:hypothetical protein
VADLMAERRSGLLVTIDEVHGGVASELRELAMTVQHAFREQRQVAFVAAGLPRASTDRLLRDDLITFLRRADRHTLGPLHPDEMVDALRRPIEDAGRSIDDDALAEAVDLARGYPFLAQLVGYHAWRHRSSESAIALEHIRSVRPTVIQRVGVLVHEPSLADLSDVDRRFLAAMAEDDGPSRVADIAARLRVDSNYLTKYRQRLLTAEMIVAPTRGYVDFGLPYLREYVRSRP